MHDAIQLHLFPCRVTLLMRRRFAATATRAARFVHEVLTGAVLRRWSNMALVLFDGARRDGSAAGCLVQVRTVLPRRLAAPAALLASAMRKGHRRG